MNAAKLARAHRRARARAETKQPRFETAARSAIRQLLRTAASRLVERATVHLTAAGDDPGWTPPADDELLTLDEIMAKYRGLTDPVRQAAVEDYFRAFGDGFEFDANWELTNPLIAAYLERTGSNVTNVAETTRTNIRGIVSRSYSEGLSVVDTAAAIRTYADSISSARAALIARTEFAGLVNGGSLVAAQIVDDASVAAGEGGYLKRWMTAPGAEYPRHEDYDGLDGQTVELDAYFDVGDDQLLYPGDPDGEPGEICNCRCGLEYVERSEAAGNGPIGGEPTPMPEPATAPPGDLVSVPVAPFVNPLTLERIEKLGINEWPPRMGETAQSIFAGLPPERATTEFLYKNVSGEWALERKELHKQIVDSFFADKRIGDQQALFTSGGGAAGKGSSTFVVRGKNLTLNEIKKRADFVVIDPDAIKAMLPEYKAMREAGDFYAAFGVHEESSYLAKVVQRIAYEQGYSIVLDTTGSGRFESKLLEAYQRGYDVQVSMSSIPTNTAIERSVARGDNPRSSSFGRYVQIPALKNAHEGASTSFESWRDNPIVSSWRLYDNSGAEPVLVAEGGLGEIRVYDSTLYQAILRKARE